MNKICIKLNKKQRLLTEKIIAYVLVSICSIFFIVPLLWMLLTALKKNFFETKDMEYFIQLALQEGYSEVVPLFILKKHGELEV